MTVPAPHHEAHRVHRAGWLRAAVLGANDGIVSTSSLLVGLAASGISRQALLLAGVAALVAGAMSMAAGEFVSVSSQADLERADLDIERAALAAYPEAEHAELAAIYVERGLEPDLAAEVARQLMAHDALGAHARDELELGGEGARPWLAAGSSALAFALGASLALLPAVLAPDGVVVGALAGATAVNLALLGAISAWAGGAPVLRAVARVVAWGLAAMGATALVGWLAGS